MADVYDITNLSRTKGFYEWATEVNNLTGQWFAVLMLIAFFLILNIIFRQYDTRTVFLASSFLTFLVSLLLFFASWVTMSVVILTIVLLAGAIIAQMWR